MSIDVDRRLRNTSEESIEIEVRVVYLVRTVRAHIYLYLLSAFETLLAA